MPLSSGTIAVILIPASVSGETTDHVAPPSVETMSPMLTPPREEKLLNEPTPA